MNRIALAKQLSQTKVNIWSSSKAERASTDKGQQAALSGKEGIVRLSM